MAPELALDYRDAIGQLATGVTVVTSIGASGPAGLTASAVCSLSLDPVLMVVCIDLGSKTLAAVRQANRLGVNVLAHDQRDLAGAFAGKQLHSEKFERVGWREVDGVPVLDGVVSWLTGSVTQLLPGGDHVIAVVEVTTVGTPGGEPLVHHRGYFRLLGEELRSPGSQALLGG